MKSSRSDAGFALAALISMITAAAVLTAIVVPLHVMQRRRETEKELIFRGNEYIRAIQKYQRKYGIYPSSVEDLLSRDGLRFIRRQYKDPITGEDFRLINVNPDGTLNGATIAKTIPVATTATGPANPFGNTTEEKAPVSNSFSEEYLHDHHSTDCFFSIVLQYHKCENADTYHAYHGELLVPPPNVS